MCSQATMSARALAAVVAACAALFLPATAGAAPFAPPPGQVYAGVTDTAIDADFNDFSALVGKPHLPIVQAFHTFGTNPSEALTRWRGYRVRGVLSISTARGYGQPGIISPADIASGEGDDYLLTLNIELAKTPQITYLRWLGEMNNGHNAYSAYAATGSSRGSEFSQSAYIDAWRRMAIIVRGGGTSVDINARLSAAGLPPLRKGRVAIPATLAAPNVALIWCPLVYGSPRTSGQRPGMYWPGPEYVDWVGTDTYSKYPAFRHLAKFYKRYRGMPFALGEWGIWDADNPGFVRELFRWRRTRPRVRMMIYHTSFGGRTNPLSLFRYPRSARATRFHMRGVGYPAYAPEWMPGAAGF